MDAIAALLAAQRAEGAFVIRSDLAAPWSIRIEDRAPLTAVVVVTGSAWLDLDGRPGQQLSTGDSALVRGEVGYTLTSRDPRTGGALDPQARIGPGQQCSRPDGSPLSEFRRLGPLSWGNVPPDAEPETVLLTGSYTRTNQACARLLAHLPTLLTVPDAAAPPSVGAAIDLLTAEVAADAAAQDVLLDRLVDLLTVSLLRAWFDHHRSQRPAWYAAYQHPVVGAVLRRMHHEPGRDWTLASLARDVGVSRATLARHFGELVGEPAMSYLTRCRLDLAADLLSGTDQTVESIAHRVGYGSAFALSNAFRRQHGHSPTHHRRQSRIGLPAPAPAQPTMDRQ